MLRRRPFQGAGRSVYKEAEAGKKVWRRANSLVQWKHRSLEVIVERWQDHVTKGSLCQAKEFGLISRQ